MCLCWCFICGSSSYSHSMGIFCPAHFFVSKVFKAPCMVTKARSTEDNEGDGMLSPSGQECVPLPRSQSSIQRGPSLQKKKSHQSEIPGDALCEPFIISPSRVCLSFNPGAQTHRTEQGFWNKTPLFLSKATTFIPFICRIVRFMVITFNYSYLPSTSSVMTHFLMQSLSTVQQSD